MRFFLLTKYIDIFSCKLYEQEIAETVTLKYFQSNLRYVDLGIRMHISAGGLNPGLVCWRGTCAGAIIAALSGRRAAVTRLDTTTCSRGRTSTRISNNISRTGTSNWSGNINLDTVCAGTIRVRTAKIIIISVRSG